MTRQWTKVRDPRKASADYLTPLPAPVQCDDGMGTQVLRWYNAHERSWVVSYADAEGRQVGMSTYVYSLSDALAEAEYLIGQAAP